MDPSPEEIAAAATAAAQVDQTLLFIFDAHIFPSNKQLLDAVQSSARRLVVILLRDVYDVEFIKDGVLSPTPIPGMPAVHAVRLSGLMDLALHPQFATNHLIYFTYTKDVDKAKGLVSTTVARGRYENGAVTNVQDLHITDSWDGAGGSASRILFGPDGFLYMTTGASNGTHAQELTSTLGKILRLRDDGTAAPGNPFANRKDAKPEIWSLGHRNTLGLMIHPSGALWNNENGPNGGDEVNIIKPGANYGWPVVSFGRDYTGQKFLSWKDGFEEPIVSWNPAIAVSGMATYTGDKFPAWKNNVFVGAMRQGEIPGTGHLERIVFNEKFEELRRESMFNELHQRVRDVRQGPDGYIYILTDEEDGALLRLEPAK